MSPRPPHSPLDEALLRLEPPRAPLLCAEPRIVFCPPAVDTPVTGEMVAKWLKRCETLAPTLYFPGDAKALAARKRVGIETLYCPRFPGVHAMALSSAELTLSFRIAPAIFAKRSGRRVAVIGWSDEIIDEAKKHGIDVLEPDSGYESLNAVWGGGSISARPRSKNKKQPPLHVCSISDTNYLPFLLGFIENIRAEHSNGVVFHILGLDDGVEPKLRQTFPEEKIEVYTLESLWKKTELPAILSRSTGFRAFSSKPRLIAKALAHAEDFVLYCDSDVHFFADPGDLASDLEDGTLLLFPHWNNEFSASRKDGVYNAGMIAVRPGAEPFLDWWGRCCHAACDFDAIGGVVGDQSYLDFAPAFFPGVKAYRRGDQNVARWNLRTLGVKWSEGEGSPKPTLWNGAPVKSYHAAFVDSVGLFEAKFAWDQLVTFFSPHAEMGEGRPFYQNTLMQLREHWLDLSRALTLHARLTSEPPTRSKIESWLSPRRLNVLAWLAKFHRAASKPAVPVADPVGDFWRQEQRSLVAAGSGADVVIKRSA